MSGFLRALKPRIASFRESMYLLSRNKLSLAALIVLLVIVIAAALAPVIIPYPMDIADATHTAIKLQAPSAEHWMGTDELGRDLFSRVVYGARVSLTAALAAVGPPLLLAIAMVAMLGSSLENAILAISLSWWPWYTRLIRGQAISVKERKFVQAAETIGTGRGKIIFKHIIPNCISPVIVQASMDIGGVILTVASLSFLGLGAQLPTPEWGLMISMGRTYFPDKWWYCIFPGLAIFITVLCFNLLGDAVREILDPKTRKR